MAEMKLRTAASLMREVASIQERMRLAARANDEAAEARERELLVRGEHARGRGPVR